jgi:predicted Zn-dependent protease with MMP-like domain
VDLSLLTSEFRAALAEAVVRVKDRSEQCNDKVEREIDRQVAVGAFEGEGKRVSQLGFEIA